MPVLSHDPYLPLFDRTVLRSLQIKNKSAREKAKQRGICSSSNDNILDNDYYRFEINGKKNLFFLILRFWVIQVCPSVKSLHVFI